MDFDTIFAQYYTSYRAEADVPASDDDEYTIGIRLANNAIRRWANYDATYWKELFTSSLDNPTGGVVSTTAGTADYAAPTAMKQAGGFVRLKNSGTTVKSIPIVDPQEVQFKGDDSSYCYFTGDPNNGFTLHVNPAPDTTGLDIDYTYYKTPSLITTGTDSPEMSNPDFMVNYMLADRFRASRNPYYTTAKRDAENYLGQMKMANDSGTWANPWKVEDRSGGVWGQEVGNGWSF